MRALPDLPVFDRAALRAASWSDSAISRALASGRLAQVRRGWFAAPGHDAERAAALAVAQARTATVLSHRTAAAMHGLPIVGARTPVPEITVPPRWAGNAADAHLHRATLGTDDVVLVDGVPITSVARTLIDLGRSRPRMSSVAALDKALHEGWVSYDDLDAVLRKCWNWPGIRRAQRAVRLADGRAESPLESVSRLVMRAVHLPMPTPQTWVRCRLGMRSRLDFYWDEFGVAGEADGRAKYRDDPDERDREKERQGYLEDDNMIFVRWGWDLPWRAPQLFRTRVQHSLERGRLRDRSGLPRYWSVEWPESGLSGGKAGGQRGL